MARHETSITDFESLLPVSGTPDLSDRMTRLAARLRDAPASAEGEALFDAAARALAALPDEAVNADHVMCLLYLVRNAYCAGDAYAGVETALQAVTLADRVGDPSLRAKALKMLGVLYCETGSYPDTVTTLTAALSAARTAGESTQEVDVLSNLGLAHQYAGHYGAAVPCFERAVELAGVTGIERVVCATALGNLALACLQLRDFAAGTAAAERAIAVLDEPANAHERMVRTMVESYYTRLLLELRAFPEARARADFARRFSEGANTLPRLFADMAKGLVDAYDPQLRDMGLSRLQRVVNDCRKGAPGALRDALAMIVRGYEAAGQPNAALVYLHELNQLTGDKRVRGVLFHHHLHISKVSRHLDRQAERAIEEQQDELRFQRLSMDALRECMKVLEKNTVAAELHDDETGEHCYRVGRLAKELALRKGMDDEMCTLIDLSARLHDIGKLRVPDSILLKPGRFSAEERAIMSQHCEHGVELIGEGGLAQLFVAQEIALNHHERWDGTGYPNRRQGNMIPLAARVAAIADVFDALTHRRCYKPAWSIEDALQEIARQRGRHFDPELTDIFLEMVPLLRAEHSDLDAYLGAEARKSDFIADREKTAREFRSRVETPGLPRRSSGAFREAFPSRGARGRA